MTNPSETTAPTGDRREREALLQMLHGQRAAVLAIVDGLPETALRTPVVPSGWTPLGVIWHLTGAEFFWFQVAASGNRLDGPPPEPDPDEQGASERWQPDRPFDTDDPVPEVLDAYRAQGEASDRVIREHPLSSPPCFLPPWASPDELRDLRGIVLHLIEETARHAGHLDIARELLDGRTGLGPR